MKTDTIEALPASKLVKDQKLKFGPRLYTEGGRRYSITATVRYDDQCGNGHNSFAITAEIRGPRGWEAGGCCHEEVAKHFPELAPFIKWHLFDSTGPMHYAANAIFWAGHSGYRDGKHNSPPNLEHLKSTIVYGALATDTTFDLQDRIYSDARGFTWNETKAIELKEWLLERLPALVAEFKRDVESLGFVY